MIKAIDNIIYDFIKNRSWRSPSFLKKFDNRFGFRLNILIKNLSTHKSSWKLIKRKMCRDYLRLLKYKLIQTDSIIK